MRRRTCACSLMIWAYTTSIRLELYQVGGSSGGRLVLIILAALLDSAARAGPALVLLPQVRVDDVEEPRPHPQQRLVVRLNKVCDDDLCVVG